MIKNHAIIAASWRRTARMNDQEIAYLVTSREDDEFTDITGQPNSRIAALNPNIYLCEFRGRQATMNEINTLPNVYVLMSETYEDTTGEIITSNFDSLLNASQLTAFANQLKSRFPGMDDEKLKRGGQAILRNGLTRREVFALLVQNFREL